MVFVFGSNQSGIHGAGAARVAVEQYGARYGQAYGMQGNSFAIPTKDHSIRTLPLEDIKAYVDYFLVHARMHDEELFKVTQIGCGLAGYNKYDIAPMFKEAPNNCHFDLEWKDLLGDAHNYWGTII